MLEPREAYRLWAPTYAAETAISFLDDELVHQLLPSREGERLLDAGCGVARRISGFESAIGVDASFEMLAAGQARNVAQADVRALPFASASFDTVWCRLVLGHLGDPRPAYAELARVCCTGGHLFVTDFHEDAVAAGHRRSFRDGDGHVHDVEHHVHGIARHIAIAERAGFSLVAQKDGIVGDSIKSFYVRAGRGAQWEKDRGLAVVAAFLFRKTCAS
jgi:malonyl-CoA O-methyltransferase